MFHFNKNTKKSVSCVDNSFITGYNYYVKGTEDVNYSYAVFLTVFRNVDGGIINYEL